MSVFVSVCLQTWLQLVNEPIGLVCADERCGWTDRINGERGSKAEVTVAMRRGGYFMFLFFFFALF